MGFRLLLIGGCPRSGTGAMANLLTLDGRALVTEEKGINAWRSKIEGADVNKLIYVGDKNPEGYIISANSLYKQFPKSKFIFTNRGGYGVVSSYVRRPLRKKNHKDIPEHKFIEWIKFGEEVWKRNYIKIKNLHKVLPVNSYLVLKYENNINNIDGLLNKLGNFLEYDSSVSNTIVWNKSTQNYGPYYRIIRIDWWTGIEFCKDTILNIVSEEFKNMNEEYEDEISNA